MMIKTIRTLADFTETERKELEQQAADKGKPQPTELLDPEHRAAVDRQLEDEHRHGPLFADVTEKFLHQLVVEQRERASAQWSLLRPLLEHVRVDDVDDRLLSKPEVRGT